MTPGFLLLSEKPALHPAEEAEATAAELWAVSVPRSPAADEPQTDSPAASPDAVRVTLFVDRQGASATRTLAGRDTVRAGERLRCELRAAAAGERDLPARVRELT
jgi:hypothetical protein